MADCSCKYYYLAENATINGVQYRRDASGFISVWDSEDGVVVVVVVSALQLVSVDTAALLAVPLQSCSTRHSCAVYGSHVFLLIIENISLKLEFLETSSLAGCWYRVSVGGDLSVEVEVSEQVRIQNIDSM